MNRCSTLSMFIHDILNIPNSILGIYALTILFCIFGIVVLLKNQRKQ